MKQFLKKLIYSAVLLIPATLSGCQSVADRPLTSLECLEQALREDSERVGFLYQDRQITMMDLEAAMELSRRLPVSPGQALRAVRSYMKAHPVEGERRGRWGGWAESLSCEEMYPKLSIFRQYYFFRTKQRFKLSYPRLVGFFVDAYSGEVIPYPGPGFSGDADDSPYRVRVPYEDIAGEGQIMTAPNDPWSLYNMGRVYAAGKVVPQSMEKAAAYFRRAADMGDPDAQYEYANCCWEGLGVPVSRGEAIRHYRMAAQRDAVCGKTALKLAQCYARGKAVPQSWKEAVFWYRKAASRNIPEAYFYLAACYERGLGVPACRQKAMKYYRTITDDSQASSEWFPEWQLWVPKATEALRRLEEGEGKAGKT